MLGFGLRNNNNNFYLNKIKIEKNKKYFLISTPIMKCCSFIIYLIGWLQMTGILPINCWMQKEMIQFNANLINVN